MGGASKQAVGGATSHKNKDRFRIGDDNTYVTKTAIAQPTTVRK